MDESITNTTVESLKKEASKASAGFDQFQDQMKDGAEKAKDTMVDVFAFSRATAEALSKSNQIWSFGLLELSRQYTAMVETTTTETIALLKHLGAAKSPQDVVEIQAAMFRSSAEKVISESSRFASAYVKIADEARAPLRARLVTAADKFVKAK